MKQKMIDFLEELNKAPEHVEVEISSKNYDAEHAICEAAIIAPLAARKLLEAVELLERVIHYGKNCREGAIYIQARGEIVKQIQKFMEDFNNEN
jgi:hypothetical protein